MAVGVIVQELCVAVLHELAEGVLNGDSDASRWLDEVTRPPEDVSFQAPTHYSGLLFIVRNRIRRALVVDHRTTPAWRRPRDPARYDDLGDFD